MEKYRFLEVDENGKPCHFHQLYSERKGHWENLTGATTILDILGKVLTWWAAELAAVECLEAGDKIPTIREEYLLAVASPDKKKAIDTLQKKYPTFKKARFAHSVKLDTSAQQGTDLHAQLEEYVKVCMYNNNSKPMEIPDDGLTPKYVVDFSKWSVEKVEQFIWSEGCCYNELLFVGGITDVGAKMKDGSIAIIDFKSAKEAYFNHFVQTAIYDSLIERNGLFDKSGKLIMSLEKPVDKYIVIPFGAKQFTVIENNNIKGLKEAALACITLYRQKSAFENK